MVGPTEIIEEHVGWHRRLWSRLLALSGGRRRFWGHLCALLCAVASIAVLLSGEPFAIVTYAVGAGSAALAGALLAQGSDGEERVLEEVGEAMVRRPPPQRVRTAMEAAVPLESVRQVVEQREPMRGPRGRYSERVVSGYKLGPQIGAGAMCEVYEAEHMHNRERVAVKLPKPSVMANPNLVERFFRELRVTARVASPHVVQLIAKAGDGARVPFLVMELLKGMTLAEALSRPQRMSEAEIVNMVHQVAAGLNAVHRAGAIHRDIKPSNIFLQTEPRTRWKVLDMGLTKELDASDMLSRGQIVGTPCYLAPEQAQCHPVGRGADVHALGLIAYRCLTGRPAFSGDEVLDIIHRVIHEHPPRPSRVARLNPEIDLVLAIALAKDPSIRFADPIAFARALSAAVQGRIAPRLIEHVRQRMASHPWFQRVVGGTAAVKVVKRTAPPSRAAGVSLGPSPGAYTPRLSDRRSAQLQQRTASQSTRQLRASQRAHPGPA